MKRFLALALLLGSVPASAATVEVANGNWSYLPLMKQRGLVQMSSEAITRIHQIVAEGECTLPGQSKRKLDMTVSFAAHFNPDGTLNRVVLKRLGCPEAEGILGGAVLELVKRGEYKPTGVNTEGWYRGELSFSSQG